VKDSRVGRKTVNNQSINRYRHTEVILILLTADSSTKLFKRLKVLSQA
jgi:hypothetical protein